MSDSRTRSIVLTALLLCVAQVAAEGLQIQVIPEDPLISPGEEPHLFVRFRNVSDETIVHRLPYAEALKGFPSDLFTVRRNGERLAYANNPEVHFVYKHRTVLRRGETLTLRVPMSLVAKESEVAGDYDIQINADYYFGGYSEPDELRITVSDQLAPADLSAPAVDLLGRPDWRACFPEPPDRRTLQEICRETKNVPIVRRRALEFMLETSAVEDLAAPLREVVDSGDYVIRYYLVDLIDEVPGAELQQDLLARALEAKDVGLRRRVVVEMKRKQLIEPYRERLRGLREQTEDEWMKEYLDQALKQTGKVEEEP